MFWIKDREVTHNFYILNKLLEELVLGIDLRMDKDLCVLVQAWEYIFTSMRMASFAIPFYNISNINIDRHHTH